MPRLTKFGFFLPLLLYFLSLTSLQSHWPSWLFQTYSAHLYFTAFTLISCLEYSSCTSLHGLLLIFHFSVQRSLFQRDDILFSNIALSYSVTALYFTLLISFTFFPTKSNFTVSFIRTYFLYLCACLLSVSPTRMEVPRRQLLCKSGCLLCPLCLVQSMALLNDWINYLTIAES